MNNAEVEDDKNSWRVSSGKLIFVIGYNCLYQERKARVRDREREGDKHYINEPPFVVFNWKESGIVGF